MKKILKKVSLKFCFVYKWILTYFLIDLGSESNFKCVSYLHLNAEGMGLDKNIFFYYKEMLWKVYFFHFSLKNKKIIYK